MGSTYMLQESFLLLLFRIRTVVSRMFPDSLSAKNLTIGKTKMAYNITHGISPYFHNQVEQFVSSAKYIVVSFDESLNEVIQKEQMDMCLIVGFKQKQSGSKVNIFMVGLLLF